MSWSLDWRNCKKRTSCHAEHTVLNQLCVVIQRWRNGRAESALYDHLVSHTGEPGLTVLEQGELQRQAKKDVKFCTSARSTDLPQIP